MDIYRMRDVEAFTRGDRDPKKNRKRVDQWVQKGILKPADPPRRAGCYAGYSLENLFQFTLTEELSDAGIGLRVAGELAMESIDAQFADYASENVPPDGLYVTINLKDTSQRKYHSTNTIHAEWKLTLTISLSQHIGDGIDTLKELGLWDDTSWVFEMVKKWK
jgi:hypothetical protein